MLKTKANDKLFKRTLACVVLLGAAACSGTKPIDPSTIEVRITPGTPLVEVRHEGEIITVMRNQDQAHNISEYYAKTSRACPPNCITPMQIDERVQTVGELEIIYYLSQNTNFNFKDVLVDVRDESRYLTGTIPGAKHLPFTEFSEDNEDREKNIEEWFKKFNGFKGKEGWEFRNAQGLVLFDDGPWDNKAGLVIKTLLDNGYLPQAIRWYRGGMQDWNIVGMTTVIPKIPEKVEED